MRHRNRHAIKPNPRPHHNITPDPSLRLTATLFPHYACEPTSHATRSTLPRDALVFTQPCPPPSRLHLTPGANSLARLPARTSSRHSSVFTVPAPHEHTPPSPASPSQPTTQTSPIVCSQLRLATSTQPPSEHPLTCPHHTAAPDSLMLPHRVHRSTIRHSPHHSITPPPSLTAARLTLCAYESASPASSSTLPLPADHFCHPNPQHHTPSCFCWHMHMQHRSGRSCR